MKKRNEDVPDCLRGLSDLLPAEVLKMLNVLIEQQQQAAHTNQGSKIEFVYVASGGQHIDTQVNIGGYPTSPKKREKGTGNLPDVLASEKAMALWEEAQAAGWIDAYYQPLISRTQSALLADAMAERLGIREKWKVFEALWNRKNMYRDYYQALGQQKTLIFQDELKKVLT